MKKPVSEVVTGNLERIETASQPITILLEIILVTRN